MSGKKTPASPNLKIDLKDKLDALLDFGGHEKEAPGSDIAERLLRLVRQLQDINRRIDNLTPKY